MDQFYKVVGEFYDADHPKKHASPTRRLMQQKEAAWEHKSVLYKKAKSGAFNDQDYSITYVVDPKKTYLI